MTEPHTTAALGVDKQLWRATFAEFKSQALRTFRGNLFDIASGGWVDVSLADAATGGIKEWSDVWPQQQWHIAFEILFCQQPPAIQAILPEHDDLLFFVYWNDLTKLKGSRIFARRKQKLKRNQSNNSGEDNTSSLFSALPSDLTWTAPLAAEIDWRSSLLLNIVLQTQYFLTVVRCLPSEVDQILDRRGTPVAKNNKNQSKHSRQSIHVTKRVHASPSTTPVNLDQTKSEDTAPSVSYPNICFGVDDFVEAFECLILDNSEDCYCVVLHADVANTWSRVVALKNELELEEKDVPRSTATVVAEKENENLEAAFEENLSLQTRSPSSAIKENSATTISVFNGYVSCTQLTTALQSYLKNPLKVLIQQRKKGQKGDVQGNTAKVLMRGPGGVGSAEVAVTDVDNNASKESLAGLVFKCAAAAVKRTVQVGEESRGSEDSDGATKLQCALMAVNIPVEALAEQILKAV